MGRFRSTGIVRLALAFVMAHGIAAAEPAPSDIAEARRLFSEASDLRTEGKWDLAAKKLEAAIAIKETAGLRFHLAYCEEKMGHLLAATRDYDRADELIRDGAK